ncbi:hypothetical protein GQ600_19915 [Phytophthora cactorum]|nr:hypothetical protein GQ600_19915 [Phytophthora cactorum]
MKWTMTQVARRERRNRRKRRQSSRRRHLTHLSLFDGFSRFSKISSAVEDGDLSGDHRKEKSVSTVRKPKLLISTQGHAQAEVLENRAVDQTLALDHQSNNGRSGSS